MKYFGTVRQKLLDGKSWYPPPPPSSIKFFYLPEIFWNTEWFSGEVFSVLWDKKKFWQNREASPLLCLKIFDTRIISKHRSVLLRILSALWDKIFSTEFSDIPLLCIKFCDTRNFLKHRSVPQRNFSVLCDKKFSPEKRDTPSSLSDALNFSIPEIFWYTEVFPNENFRYCETKNFERKVVITHLLHKI